MSALGAAGKVLKYSALPGIGSRVEGLFASGFGFIAFFMAQIYAMVRLLPADHPYLKPENMRRYRLRDVVAEAANIITFSRKNIDQIIVFILLLLGLVLLFVQFALLVGGFILQPAMAGAFGSLFNTANPQYDVAFMLLDRVFGVPGLFNSCVAQQAISLCNTANPGPNPNFVFPTPFQSAYHEMLRFYSMGILVIATLIFLYFVVVVVAESAATGTPFGHRFQNVWVPIRLMMAVSMLVPINHGLNTAQYVLLAAAKYGSGFATNGWIRYNNAIATGSLYTAGSSANPTGEYNALVAKPTAPGYGPVVDFMVLAHACAYSTWADKMKNATEFPAPTSTAFVYTQPYQQDDAIRFNGIKAYLVKNAHSSSGGNTDTFLELTANTTYTQAMAFFNNSSNIIIRFGERDPVRYEKEMGNVLPSCGEIQIPIIDVRATNVNASDNTNPSVVGGPAAMQRFNYIILRDMWFQVNNFGANIFGGAVPVNDQIVQLAQKFSSFHMPRKQVSGLPMSVQCVIASYNVMNNGNVDYLHRWSIEPLPTGWDPGCEQGEGIQSGVRLLYHAEYQQHYNAYVQASLTLMRQNLGFWMGNVQQRGWGGAALWYHQIADMNGQFVSAVNGIPQVRRYPLVMEKVKKARLESSENVSGAELFSPTLGVGKEMELSDDQQGIEEQRVAKVLYLLFKFMKEDQNVTLNSEKFVTGNPFKDIMNMVFGVNGVFAMRGDNAVAYPMAALTTLGKGLIDSAITNVFVGAGLGGLGGFMASAKLFEGLSDDVSSLGNIASSTAFLGLTAGIVLYYILPMLPFLYFFFAMCAWVKGIFEGMVGVPLWALAHLRIDGEGLPGEAAANGYYLILETFLRPIMIVIGLVASLTIFTAEVRVLHIIWDLVTDNVSGYVDGQGIGGIVATPSGPKRGVIDQFFFTVIYTMIVYLLATSSFKLIDAIPNSIMRWAGVGVSTFSDSHEGAVGQLSQRAVTGSMLYTRQVTGAVKATSSGIGSLGGNLVAATNKLNTGGRK